MKDYAYVTYDMLVELRLQPDSLVFPLTIMLFQLSKLVFISTSYFHEKSSINS